MSVYQEKIVKIFFIRNKIKGNLQPRCLLKKQDQISSLKSLRRYSDTPMYVRILKTPISKPVEQRELKAGDAEIALAEKTKDGMLLACSLSSRP